MRGLPYAEASEVRPTASDIVEHSVYRPDVKCSQTIVTNVGCPMRNNARWSAYVLASRYVNRAVDRDLKLSHDLISDDFGILDLLAAEPDGRIRFGELAARLQFPKAHLTYRFQRLEAQGFVVRERCEDDGRGAYARLTCDGRAMLESAAPVHVESVRRHLLDHLDEELVAQLESAMSAVLRQGNGGRRNRYPWSGPATPSGSGSVWNTTPVP